MPKPFYIIGPISDYKDRNQPAFEQARLRLEKATNSMCDIPHDLIPEEASWETAMLISINKLTGRSFPSMAPTFRIALLPAGKNSGRFLREKSCRHLRHPLQDRRRVDRGG